MNLSFIAAPLVGSLIGYCTNFIAVKMLFFPKKEIRIKGHKVPFTPGAIPKGKPRLANAIGDIVGNTLVTKEDIEEKLLSDQVVNGLADSIMDNLSSDIKTTIMEITSLSEENYASGKEKLANVLSTELADTLSKMDLENILVEKGGALIKQKLSGNMMLAMFLNDDLIRSVLGPLGTEFQKIIGEQGAEFIQPALNDKLSDIEEKSSLELIDRFDISETVLRNIIISLYKKVVSNGIGKIFDKINIKELVKEKIDNMDIDELEDMVLTVMKKELDTIVNLGAVIGFILGLINIVF